MRAKSRPLTKSEAMAAVRTKQTAPEELVAVALRDASVRFRRNITHLPGSPDFVLNELGIVLFVHGCFWHGHRVCRKGRTASKTNSEFWKRKISGNAARDSRTSAGLRRAGYSVLTVWECELRNGALPPRVAKKLVRE